MTGPRPAVAGSLPSPAWLLAVQFLLQKASNNLLYLSLLTVFLKSAGPEGLPWIYVLVNLSFIGLQFGIASRTEGREGHWLLAAFSWPAVIFAVAAGATVQGASGPLLMVFLILAILIDLFTNQAFSNMANQYLPLQEAKQVLPGIFAAGSLGYILSGILLKFVLDIVGIRGLLWFTALLIVIQHLLLVSLEPYERATQGPVPAVPATTPAAAAAGAEAVAAAGEAAGGGTGAKGGAAGKPTAGTGARATGAAPPTATPPSAPGVTPPWRHPLAQLLIVSSFLILFNKYLIDYLFAGAVNRHFPSAQDLAVFMGVFGASADLTVIGLQTLVMNHVFARFPIGRVLMVVPALLVLLCGGAAFGALFLLVVTIQFFVLLNSKNFTVPATSILLGAVRQQERGAVRRHIGIACSVSSLLVGGILLAVRGRVSPEGLFLTAALGYVLMAWAHHRLDAAYAQTLRQTISESPEADDPEWLESLRFLGARERFSRLQDLLTHPEPGIRKGAIREAALLSPDEVHRLLLPMLETERDPACLAAVARTLLDVLGPDTLCNLEMLLAGNDDPRLTADLLEAIGRVGSGEAIEDMVELFLAHDHHRIRGSAAMSLLRLTRRPERLEEALRGLARMARDRGPLSRATAAAVMGEMAMPLFIPALEVLSTDPDETVARNALQALAKMQSSRALAILESRCQHPHPGVAGTARALFREASRQGIAQIGSLLKGFSGAERHRLAQSLRTMHGERLLGLLARVLGLERPVAREGLVRLLQEGHAETIELVDRCLATVGEDGSEISLEPVWERLQETFAPGLPRWTEAIPFLAQEVAGSDRDVAALDTPRMIELLRRVWLEGVALELAPELQAAPFPPERLARLRETWRQRAEGCARAMALTFPDPAPVLRAIDQLAGTDPFTRSVARELLETQFGTTLLGWLEPLLRPTGVAGPETAAQDFLREARERGMGVDVAADRERLLPLLVQITQVEATA